MKKEFSPMAVYFVGAAVGAAIAAQDNEILTSPLYIGLLLVALYVVSGIAVIWVAAIIGEKVQETFIDTKESKGGRLFFSVFSVIVWCLIVFCIAGQDGILADTR